MLTLDSIPHSPHGYSASMVATWQENTHLPDLITDTHPSLFSSELSSYVSGICMHMQAMHKLMTYMEASVVPNPYKSGDLKGIYTPY